MRIMVMLNANFWFSNAWKRSKSFSKIENKLKWTFSKISENHPKFTYMTTAVKKLRQNIFLKKESVENVKFYLNFQQKNLKIAK